jgi:hypothetical protein
VRFASRWALASLAALPIAGAVYLLGRLEGNRMVDAGQGWEMAFYWSPILFLVIDALLLLGGVVGIAGLAIGPGVHRRAQSFATGLACVASYALLPWR